MSSERKIHLHDIYTAIYQVAHDLYGRAFIGGRLNLGAPTVGVLPPSGGGTGTTGGAEPPLGNPAGDHYVLTSSAAGVRRWVPLIAGAGISLDIDGTTGAITISATGNIQTLTFGGDDLTFGGELIKWGAV